MDGAGKVDGSVVVALPTDHPFEGGGLTVWDGKAVVSSRENNAVATGQTHQHQPEEIHYDTRSGDVAFIDRYVGYMRSCCVMGAAWLLSVRLERARERERSAL